MKEICKNCENCSQKVKNNVNRKIISIDNLRKLPEGTDVYFIEEGTGKVGRFWIAKTYKGRKLLKGVFSEKRLSDVKEIPGFHFEIERR